MLIMYVHRALGATTIHAPDNTADITLASRCKRFACFGVQCKMRVTLPGLGTIHLLARPFGVTVGPDYDHDNKANTTIAVSATGSRDNWVFCFERCYFTQRKETLRALVQQNLRFIQSVHLPRFLWFFGTALVVLSNEWLCGRIPKSRPHQTRPAPHEHDV